ncbi:MAG: ABC transporter permease [Gammaproteobacteria bacterium]|nr:ABC transporter permease [Gammaproteobacteria bacterium]MDH4312115.1 ABC transporter permease [Gammaproteobacteria bacterium]MDH5274428.1 ABC transporter permease [Gammaproteobacteria bacterium]
MFSYDLRLALDSMKRHPGLSALMVLAIALGIAVCTVTFTIYHAMATNPIPDKSSQLYAVTLDTWSAERPYDDEKPDLPPQLLTYRDAMYLYGARAASRSVVMYKSGALLLPERNGVKPFNAQLRVTTHEFFPMFDVPFQYGQGWDAAADEGPQPVVVLNHETNVKVFGGENSVGRTLKLGKVEYRVVGVLQPWAPSPKFFDLNNGSFDDPEDAYIPYGWGKALEMPVYGNTNCWKPEVGDSYQDFLNSECIWLQLWAELPTVADRDKYQAFIDNYARSQKAAGRMPRPLNNRLYDVGQWLDRNDVVQKDNRVLIGIALLFLGVCLVNVVGLLLAKFLNAAPLTGLRRALGASRRDIIRQHMTEVLLIGLAGGVLGILLAVGGLAGIRAIYGSDFTRGSYERLTEIDPFVVLVTLALSLLAGTIAGLYPSWRIGRTAPAVYLKTQ